MNYLYLAPALHRGRHILIQSSLLQTSKAATLFAHEENKPFHFIHCWHKLKGEPKWESICQGPSFRGLHGKSFGSSGGPTIGGQESDSGSAGLTGKRSLGCDSSKSERKKVASSSSTEYLSRLQDLTGKQIQRCCWGPSASEGPQKQDLTVFLEYNV
jgi:hypothetical protein